MTIVTLEVPFSATHQIVIAGELEPVHGHDFRCVAEIQVEDARDASLLLPAVERALAPLRHTHLQAVHESEQGQPSAERIARYLFARLAEALADDDGARVAAVTAHESPGCSATYTETAADRRAISA